MRKLAFVLVVVLWCAVLLYGASESKSRTYTMPDYSIYSMSSEITQVINANTAKITSDKICAGDSRNLREYVDYAVTQNTHVITHCDISTSTLDCDKSKYTIVGEGIASTAEVISENEYNILKNSGLKRFTAYGVLTQGEKNVVDEISGSRYGGAHLARMDIDGKICTGCTHIKYAKSRGGLGCTGTYKITVIGPDGSTAAVYEGPLEEFAESTKKINYKFDRAGQYTVNYETAVKTCVGILSEEPIGGTRVIHPFFDPSGLYLPFVIKESVKLDILSGINVPDIIPSQGVIDNEIDPSTGKIVPKTLTENKQDTFTLRFSLSNPQDSSTDMKITSISWPLDATSDTKIAKLKIDNAVITPSVGSGITLKPGQTLSVEIKTTATAPKGSVGMHTLKVDYSYDATAIGICASGASEKRGGSVYATIQVLPENVQPQDNLGVTVRVTPPLINTNNYEKVNKDGVKVDGYVLLNPGKDNIGVEGANVTLWSITKHSRKINSGKPLTSTLCYLPPENNKMVKTDKNGYYDFSNVPLTLCKIGGDEEGFLNATVTAEYAMPGKAPLRTQPTSGGSTISTPIPDPTCTLTYKRKTGNVETYEITVNIKNWKDGFVVNTAGGKEKGSYDCGSGGGPVTTGIRGSLKGENPTLTFECSYGAELTPEMSRVVVYGLDYKKTNDQRAPFTTMVCREKIGMCYVQLG
ncbi:MAG: hypothetical protein QXS93_03375 [Candidatus Micrarchaeia archaeon]